MNERMSTYNICCVYLQSSYLPEDGHILWPKHVAALNNKYCATYLEVKVCMY